MKVEAFKSSFLFIIPSHLRASLSLSLGRDTLSRKLRIGSSGKDHISLKRVQQKSCNLLLIAYGSLICFLLTKGALMVQREP